MYKEMIKTINNDFKRILVL
jgi:hypothetical protein